MTRTEAFRTASGSTLPLPRIAVLASVVALHVTTGTTLLAAFLHWRRNRSDQHVLIWAAVVFVLALRAGGARQRGHMAVHVPGALVITVGVVRLAAWSLRAHR